MAYKKVSRSFYDRDDVVEIARELIGKVLCTNINGHITKGMIVETEAYDGSCDNACHAYSHGLTERNKVMFGAPGFSYIYLCYGIHHLFNIVTNSEGKADAVLIRAIEPIEGVSKILERRNKKKLQRSVGGGPGIVSSALGITTEHYGEDLFGDVIWVEDHGNDFNPDEILASERVGIDYAGEDANLPWRFRLKGNPFTSPAS
ncbi:MAG TPA: DNA-3-methyladenine glycosylase [Balneolaceae bacterium]|nr:DNA-3-methyladenine glycosylase [Balneolaceae bacterium]|tara:strand:- start:58923 stop:59531 length:609 start_codon:yes stop_codon:yes gene_type:complete